MGLMGAPGIELTDRLRLLLKLQERSTFALTRAIWGGLDTPLSAYRI